VRYVGAAALANAVRAEHASMVFVTPGFADDLGAIRGDQSSGRPKLLVHLTQAKKQHVAFSADVLKLMRVYE
jgi:hypothetical protein